jgi:colicin import membrane protein
MVKITARQVEKAEARAAEQEQAREAAAAALDAAPYSEFAAQELAEASRMSAQLRASARELREKFDEQVAAEQSAATREEREKAAAKEIAAAGKEMAAARKELEQSAEVAQRALVALMAAAEAYDGLVGQHADALAAAGLGLDGETGGGRGLFTTTVRVRGAAYEDLSPAGALLWVADRVAEARLPHMSPVRASLSGLLGYRAWEQRGDDLMSGVPEVLAVKHPELPRVVNSFQAQLAASK